MPRPPRSLKGRALQWLAQREQSRVELRRKLRPHALDEARAALASTAAATDPTAGIDRRGSADAAERAAVAADDDATDRHSLADDAAARVEAVLTWLEANGFLSDARFVESRVQARSARFGNLRIRHELKQHHLTLDPDHARVLAASEAERARQLRERRFGLAPVTPAQRAKQMRFLAGRGFSSDAIRRAMAPGSHGDADPVERPDDAAESS